MNGAIVQEPVTKGAFGTHHVGVLLRRHALPVLVAQLRPIDVAHARVGAAYRLAVRWRTVLVWLGDDVLFRAGGGGAAALELCRELARVGHMADGRCWEEGLSEAAWTEQGLSRQQEARYRVERGHGGRWGELRTADCELRTANCELRIGGCGGPMGKIEVTRDESAEGRAAGA